jgi:hypothetical protein
MEEVAWIRVKWKQLTSSSKMRMSSCYRVSFFTRASQQHEEQLALEPLHVDAVLTELTVAKWDGGTCLRRDLQHPGHLPGYGRRDGKEDKVAHPELDVEAPWHLDDLVMSLARFSARRRPGLPLPEIGNRPRNFWARVDVGVHEELVLHSQRPVHVADEDGVPVLYMMRRMNPHQHLPLSVLNNFYQCLHNNVYQCQYRAIYKMSTQQCLPMLVQRNLYQCLHNNIYQANNNVYQANTNGYFASSLAMSTANNVNPTMSTANNVDPTNVYC